MTKNEFIEKLKKKLEILDDNEVNDIISEYEGYIEEKMASGMSEKDAVKALGNINEIASDLLSAYKIKDNYNDKNEKNIIDKVMDKVISYIDIVIKVFENKSFGEIVKMFIKIFLLTIAIRICKFPLDVLLSVVREIINPFNSSFGNYLFYLIKVIVNIIYIILALVFFFKVLDEKIIGKDFMKEIKKEDDNNKEKTTKIDQTKDSTVIQKSETREKGILDLLTDIVVIFVKFIVSIITIGNIIYIVGVSCALAIMVYMIINGITYYGPMIIIIALLIFGVSFFDLFIRFIFNSKQKTVRFIITLLISLIIGGIGVGITTIEFANTEIIETTPEDNSYKTYTEKLEMNDNLVFSSYLVNDYIEDETLGNEIKIEYKYIDLLKFKPYKYVTEEGEYTIYNFNYSLTWNKKSFDKLMNMLKNKKLNVYNSDIEVYIYANKDNINKLKTNYDNYRKIIYEVENDYVE